MKHQTYKFPDGSAVYAFGKFEAFIKWNAARIQKGQGIASEMVFTDEKGRPVMVALQSV